MNDERLDERCGAHLTYRALMEAGETWHHLRPPNIPVQQATWMALRQLATDILDPVANRFGSIVITYAFAGRALTRHIRRHIDPARDQHAGHELKPDGAPICSRLGQAADFRIAGVSSARIATWVASELPFDRLYFYGEDRPLHVSIGPENTRSVVEMIAGPSGHRVPRRRQVADFVARHGGEDL